MESLGIWESAEALNALRYKWTALVLRHLAEGVVRPGQLKRTIGGLSTKVLYERLHALQGSGLVRVHVFHGYPQRAEYHLTDQGWRLVHLISACEQRGIPLPVLADVLKCRWLRDILRILQEGPQRPTHLRKRLEGISSKVLAEKLQKLERLRLISREVRATRPVTVWYRLSEEGRRLSTILGL